MLAVSIHPILEVTISTRLKPRRLLAGLYVSRRLLTWRCEHALDRARALGRLGVGPYGGDVKLTV